MSKIRFSLLAIVTVSALSAAAPDRLDGIAAVVGDEVILQSELDAYSLLRLNSLRIHPDSVDMQKFRTTFLQELIDGKVLLVHAKEDTTITVKNEEVEQAVTNHINMLLQQNNLTLDSLESVLRNQQGISLAKFRSEARQAIREQLLKQKVQQSYIADAKVNRRDVEEFYAQYKDSLPQAGESVLLSRLSLRLAPSDSVRQLAYEKIRSIKQRLDAGGDFAELARQHSESPEGQSGGDLGFIAKGTLGELAFEEKAFSLAPGQTSEPFETRLGFHIINIVAKRDRKVQIRQIFIKVAPPEQQLQMISARLDSIRSNCSTQAAFVECVKKFSDDASAKGRNGRVGWKSLLELSGDLRSAIDTLEAGSITAPIREENIISIYRIDDRVKSRKLTLADDWTILAEKTKDIQAQKKMIAMVSKWRKSIFIDIRM